jgi:glycosyltransferase involved in cell wall biosynthesis
MRIGLVGTEWTRVQFGSGGLEHLVLGWAAELARSHEVTVFSVSERGRNMRLGAREAFKRVDLSHPSQLSAAAHAAEIDVLQLNNRPGWLTYFDRAFVTFHNFKDAWLETTSPLLGNEDVAQAIAEAPCITTVSHALGSHVEAVTGRAPNLVTRPFVAAEFLTCPIQRSNSGVVLYAGRLLRKKGVNVIVDAKRRGLLDSFDVAFTNYIAPWTTPTAEHLALQSVIRQTPGCHLIEPCSTRSEMVQLLADAAVVVIPSIEPEAFGLVSIEAQAVGRPVVVADSGGLRETVPSKEYIVTPGDADALGQAIANAASDDVDPQSRRQWVEQNFTIADSTAMLERAIAMAARRDK